MEFARVLVDWLQNSCRLWLTPGACDNLVPALLLAMGSAVVWLTLTTGRWAWDRLHPGPAIEPRPPIVVQVQPVPAPPPERPLPRPPGRKVPLERFVARHDEQGRDLTERVVAALQSGGVVTLYGAGGNGKTTLAAEVVNRLFPQPYAGGVVWASADGRPDFGLVALLDAVLIELGRADVEARSLGVESRAELARSLLNAATPCLLGLDNFETIPAEEQQAILRFFEALPCPVLVTGRDRLSTGENIRVGPMTSEEADAFLISLVERSEYRARLARVDRAEIACVAEHNPMLMRWVVRQLEEAMEPRDVFDHIARGRGEAAERIFGRSFRVLDVDAQAALLALALFAPSVGREALAAVCGFGDDRDRLNTAVRRLARHDLLETDDGRLSLVALTRTLAQAELAHDPRGPELRQHFTDYFLAYSQTHAGETLESIKALEAELGNLLAAMDCAYAASDRDRLIMLLSPLHSFLNRVGRFAEREKYTLHAINLISSEEAVGEREAARSLWSSLGYTYIKQGQLSEAREALGRTLEVEKQIGYPRGRTLWQLAIVAFKEGKYDEACRLLVESHQAYRRSPLHKGRKLWGVWGDIRYYQAKVLIAQGELDRAKTILLRNVHLEKRLSKPTNVARAHIGLGDVAIGQGQFDEAHTHYETALRIAQEWKDRPRIAEATMGLGRLEHRLGKVEVALNLAENALEGFRSSQMLMETREALNLVSQLKQELATRKKTGDE